MPRVSVYPDRLYDTVRKHDISISAVTRQALEAAVRRHANAAWVERVRSRLPRLRVRVDTSVLLDEVRSEFG